MMDCGMKSVFNLVFAICGLALLVTGGIIQGGHSQYLDFLGDQFFDSPNVLMGVGCIIFFVAFFGCCGAIKESYQMNLFFAFLLAIIFIMEIGTGIAAYKLRTKVNKMIEKNMEDGMQHFNLTGYDGVTVTWNVVQRELKCCGTQEYLGRLPVHNHWSNTTFSKTTFAVPDSCCLSYIENCGVGLLKENATDAGMNIHTKGCFDTFSTMIKKNVSIVSGVGIGIAFIQFVGLIFACRLARAINSNYEEI